MKRMLLLLSIVLLAACGKTIPDAKNWPVDDFTFTDQNGQSFGLSDLKGKVWVADFIPESVTKHLYNGRKPLIR